MIIEALEQLLLFFELDFSNTVNYMMSFPSTLLKSLRNSFQFLKKHFSDDVLKTGAFMLLKALHLILNFAI